VACFRAVWNWCALCGCLAGAWCAWMCESWWWVPCVPAAFMAGMLALLRTDEAREACNVARRETEWVCACGESQETRIKSQENA
jgi:hypothetical protein